MDYATFEKLLAKSVWWILGSALMLTILILLTMPTDSAIEDKKNISEPETSLENTTVFKIDGVDVVLTPHLPEGVLGESNKNQNRITIRSGRTLEEMKETCEHELLHLRGANHRTKGAYDYVYELDGMRNSQVCIEMIYRLGSVKG